MKNNFKQLEYLNSFDFIDRYCFDMTSSNCIPNIEEVHYSINTKHCQIHHKGTVTFDLTDEARIKLYAILELLSGTPVSVKIDPLDLQKIKKKKKQNNAKDSNQQEIKLNYILESKIKHNSFLRAIAILFTTLSYRSHLFEKINYRIIPHKTGKVKLVLWVPLNAYINLYDLDRTAFKEFSFKDIPLKIELILANKTHNLNIEEVKSFIFNLFPFYILSSKFIKNNDNH